MNTPKSRFFKILSFIAVALALTFGANHSTADEHAKIFDKQQTKAIESIVTDYLIANPEVIVRAMQALEERDAADAAARAHLALDQLRPDLENDPNSPVGGNPDGDVTIVEFFDYRCPYCKKVAPDVARLIKSDSNVRVVYKEWPILGPESVVAARAALAADAQGKYLEFHEQAMEINQINEAKIMKLAEGLGLDVAKLKKDMNAPSVEEHLRKTMEISQALGIQGTPAFVIGTELLRGAVPYEQMSAIVSKTREKAVAQ